MTNQLIRIMANPKGPRLYVRASNLNYVPVPRFSYVAEAIRQGHAYQKHILSGYWLY